MMRHLCIVLVALLSCFELYAQSIVRDDQKQIQKLNYVYNYIRNNYVDDVPLDPLVEAAIISALEELDPHSTYLNVEQMGEANISLKGEFSGIGISYAYHRDTLVVRRVSPNSPAHRMGISTGDRIVAIDTTSLIGLNVDTAKPLLMGKRGSKFSLNIIRPGEDASRSVKLTRDIIDIESVSAAFVIDNVGYIRLGTFSNHTPDEVKQALKGMKDVEALIVDLRNNSGGLLPSCLAVSEMFLDKGATILTTESRAEGTHTYVASKNGELRTLPVIVLINEESASASEIFAGALQDNDRALIMGRRSYGKGLVQRQVEFFDGSALRLTVARYKTPSGRTIQRPYQNGDRDGYFEDMSRYANPNCDTLNAVLPIFHTLHSHREVYGGGGIMPDIYVSVEEQPHNALVADAIRELLVDETVLNLYATGEAQRIKNEHKTINDFKHSYTLDRAIIDSLFTAIDELGIAYTAEERMAAEPYLEGVIKATIAADIFGQGGYYYIYNTEHDILLNRALEYAHDPKLVGNILSGNSQ